MNWGNLNSYYEKINKTAEKLLREVINFDPEAKLFWNNLRKVERNGEFETEYIPFPIVEANFNEKHFVLGVSFMNEIWAEITVSAKAATEMNFSEIAGEHEIEIYGAQKQTEFFYHKGMDLAAVNEKINLSGEEKITIYFVPQEKNIIEYIMYI